MSCRDGLTRLERILRRRTGNSWFRSRCRVRWVPLVPTYEIVATVLRNNFALNVKVPLLHVRPDGLSRD